MQKEKKQSAKEKVETIDDDNKVITYSVFDGEVGESYKSLKVTLQVIDKEYGGLVKWTFEYEKLKEDITGPSPDSFLDLLQGSQKILMLILSRNNNYKMNKDEDEVCLARVLLLIK